jgi:hypothetical protein
MTTEPPQEELARQEALNRIQKEFACADEARTEGNEARVRVCARRAAGASIAFWLTKHTSRYWGVDAMNQLRNAALDQTVPQGVRSAAHRLTIKITDQFIPATTTDPIDDAKIIIDHFMSSP